ncbi:MAG: LamG-like jellyroll fold domain-containing protein [Luteolibacter sp.]
MKFKFITSFVLSAGLATGLKAASLVGYWNFDDQSLVNSGTTGSVHDGVSRNGSVFYSVDTPSGTGRALDLTQNDAYVEIQNTIGTDANYQATFDSGLQNGMTISVWAKGHPGIWEPYVSKNGEATAENLTGWGYQLRVQENTNVFTIRGTAGTDDPTGSVNTNDEDWHMITGTWNPVTGVRALYVDGVLDIQITGDTGSFPFPTGEHLLFGNREISTTQNDEAYSSILLDEVRIYNGALDSNAVSELYSASLIPEPSVAFMSLIGAAGLVARRRR